MTTRILLTTVLLSGLLLQGCARDADAQGQAQSGARLLIERDIEYVSVAGQSLRLDIYRMNPASAPSPVVIWIHDTADPAASKVATPATGMMRRRDANSVAVVSIEYRNDGTEAEQLADAKAAVRWVREQSATYSFDPDRIAVVGFGTGAHLAALLGTTAGIAVFDGSSDISTRVHAVVALAGPTTSASINPVSYVTPDDAPSLLIHGTADANVSTLESQALVAALKVAGVTTTLELSTGIGHDLGKLLSPVAMQSVAGFVDRHLQGQQNTTELSRHVSTPAHTFIDPVALNIGGTFYELYPTQARGPDTFASYRIYFPPDYDSNPTRRYPVIYFLHGRSVDSKRTVDAGYIARADAAIRAGVMPPAIIVLPQGLNTGWYLDTEDGQYPMESVLIRDLIPHIDATYRSIATREARAIEGHSMGGYGALHIGFKFPELFAAVTGNSAAIVDYPGSDNVGSEEFFASQAPATFARKNLDAVREQNIRIIVGTRDRLIRLCEQLSDELTAMGVDHEFIPVQASPHNIDQLLQYETFDRMAVYNDVFADL